MYGGAALISGGGQLLAVNGATFSRCSADLYGGIVYGQQGGLATFVNAYLYDSSAAQAGGVIGLNAVDATFEDCTILRSEGGHLGGVLCVLLIEFKFRDVRARR